MAITRQHHAELNKVSSTPARFAELRREYAGDRVAQQEIDAYDGESPYHLKYTAYLAALREGRHTEVGELNRWLKEHYPDV
jgi:hypothetical protein